MSGVEGSRQTRARARARNAGSSSLPAKVVTPATALRERDQPANGKRNGASAAAMARPSTPKPRKPTPKSSLRSGGRTRQTPSRWAAAYSRRSRYAASTARVT